MVKIGTKEAPLFAAAAQAGALPGFLTGTPAGAGVTCGAMVPVFGGVFGMFAVMSSGVGDMRIVYEATATVALVAGAACAAFLMLVLLAAPFSADGRARAAFALSAIATLMIWAGLWGLAHPWLHAAASGYGWIA